MDIAEVPEQRQSFRAVFHPDFSDPANLFQAINKNFAIPKDARTKRFWVSAVLLRYRHRARHSDRRQWFNKSSAIISTPLLAKINRAASLGDKSLPSEFPLDIVVFTLPHRILIARAWFLNLGHRPHLRRASGFLGNAVFGGISIIA